MVPLKCEKKSKPNENKNRTEIKLLNKSQTI